MRIFENIDYMEGMEKYRDILTSRRVLAIVDPPYGISRDGGKTGKNWKWHEPKEWDAKRPEANYFNLLFNRSSNQIIFGANYFVEYLPASMGWIFWDKGQKLTMSDGELMFSSFDCALRSIVMNRCKIGENGGFIHPTQKPIALYKWLLENYSKGHDLILDTHVGSASSLIACEEFGIDYVGFELDKDYFNDATKRIEKARFEREAKASPECVTDGLSLFKGDK